MSVRESLIVDNVHIIVSLSTLETTVKSNIDPNVDNEKRDGYFFNKFCFVY